MFEKNVKLSLFSNYKIGGPARFFFASGKLDNLVKGIEKARAAKLPLFVLGGGTNILFDDSGFDGLVLKPAFKQISLKEDILQAGAGVEMKDLVDFCLQKSLSGLEWAAGLPGTVGGAIRGNAGAFGGEIKDNAVKVISLDISDAHPKVRSRSGKACDFGYRSSIFKKKNDEIILEVFFSLKEGDKKKMQESIDEKLLYRQEHQPFEYPNIGSIFKNVEVRKISKTILKILNPPIKKDPFPVVPSAFLISELGLKGVSCGGAMISSKHPNFIVNVLGASSGDVKDLIKMIKDKAEKKFKINLEEEIVIL